MHITDGRESFRTVPFVLHRWKIRWSGIAAPGGAASFDPSASEQRQKCMSHGAPQGRRPPHTAAADTEGWSRTCLQKTKNDFLCRNTIQLLLQTGLLKG